MSEPLQLGFARESDVFAGVLAPSVLRLDDATKDRFLLLELHRMLLERALCYREITPDKGPISSFLAASRSPGLRHRLSSRSQ